MTASDDAAVDRAAIRDVVENWALWRDSGDWENFATVWHPDAQMNATWFQGSASEFSELSRKGFESGVQVTHLLAGASIKLSGTRAVAQTKMVILQRAPIGDVLCDVTCYGRFFDLLEKRDGEWRISVRKGIYERDRLDPVDPSATLTLDPEVLARFPDGYQHLAYLQHGSGMTVNPKMPGLTGPEVDLVYSQGEQWLNEAK